MLHDSMPVASVIMPVYQTPPDMLRAAIRSILGQSFEDLELIIVEDPSAAVRTSVVEEFGDPRLRYYLNSERTGLVSQRNQGLQLSRGEFIVKADSDDLSVPRRCEEQIAFLQANEAIGVVGSWLEIIDADGNRLGTRDYPTDPDSIYQLMRRRNPVAQPAVCFRRDLVNRFGGYPDGYPVCQDYAYWSHLARQGVRFANLSERLVRYRLHANSIKSKKMRETLDATIRIKRAYWSDEMGAVDQLRIVGEKLLRYVPPAIVQGLFRLTSLQREKHVS